MSGAAIRLATSVASAAFSPSPPAQPAGWWRRGIAHVIDTWGFPLVLGWYVLPSLIRATFTYVQDWIQAVATEKITFGHARRTAVFDSSGILEPWMWMLIIGWPIFILWNLFYLQGRYGRSIGKWLMSIRTIRTKDGRPPGFWRAAWRWLTQRLNLLVPGGILLAVWDPYRQSVADKLANTMVVADPDRLHRKLSSFPRGETRV